jgi:Family of unknown function (DUF6221)
MEIVVPTSFAAAVTTNQDLVRFLLARVADDENELRKISRGAGTDASGLRSIERLQAELTAKRRLIGSLQQLVVLRDQPAERAVRHQAGQMLRFMALPYEWHAQYRQEWRPAGSH